MKKVLALLLAVVMIFALAACGQSAAPAPTPAATEAPSEEPAAEAPAEEAPAEEAEPAEATEVEVMSYADYVAADLDTEVTVETYVQDKQGWWNDQATFYTQNEDGAFFLYNMPCSQEEYDALVPGTKIRVTGYKSEWSGEVEIIDISSFEVIEGDTFVAGPVTLDSIYGTDQLADFMNQRFSLSDVTIVAKTDESTGEELAFFYDWDNSGAEKQDADLYFDGSVNGETFTFVVEYYLRGEDSDVYQTVKNLKVGDVIDLEGFLYWYNGPQPHITAVTVK